MSQGTGLREWDGGGDGSGGLVEPGLHIVEEGYLLLGRSNSWKSQEQWRGAHVGLWGLLRPPGMRNVELIVRRFGSVMTATCSSATCVQIEVKLGIDEPMGLMIMFGSKRNLL